MHPRIWAALAGTALTWGTTGVATRAALNDGVPTIGLTAIRTTLAAVVLTAIATGTRRRMGGDRATWRLGWVMAVFNLTLPFVVITFAYRYASAGFVGFIVALIPLATALIAHYLLPDEPLHLAKVGALTVALAGVGFLLASGDSGLAEGGKPILAASLTLVGVVAIGYAGVYAKRVANDYDPITVSALMFVLGVPLLVPLMAITEGLPRGISAWGWLLIGYLTVFGSVIPFILYYWVLRHVSSTVAASIGYLVPLVALVTGIVLIDERLQMGIAVGGVLILAGVVLTGRVEYAGAQRRAASV